MRRAAMDATEADERLLEDELEAQLAGQRATLAEVDALLLAEPSAEIAEVRGELAEAVAAGEARETAGGAGADWCAWRFCIQQPARTSSAASSSRVAATSAIAAATPTGCSSPSPPSVPSPLPPAHSPSPLAPPSSPHLHLLLTPTPSPVSGSKPSSNHTTPRVQEQQQHRSSRAHNHLRQQPSTCPPAHAPATVTSVRSGSSASLPLSCLLPRSFLHSLPQAAETAPPLVAELVGEGEKGVDGTGNDGSSSGSGSSSSEESTEGYESDDEKEGAAAAHDDDDPSSAHPFAAAASLSASLRHAQAAAAAGPQRETVAFAGGSSTHAAWRRR
ncbi:hypothetical protein CLOM_g16978 [Closterium sp. NIES-68]|nr:hypothetical protein CLOM_g16978 [Closterium sp. NIES-68]